MFPILRWETLHPALVHLTVGAVPLILLAYAVAAWRRSERWSFMGDVVTIATALVTVFVAGAGLIALLRVDWPGGLEPWRNLHVASGLLITVGLLALAGFRVRARRRGQTLVGMPAAFAAAGLVLAVLVGGWIGGEVLVFQSGIAVEAAGNGALSPRIVSPSAWLAGDPRAKPPKSLHDAMIHARGAWAEVNTQSARMTVEHPDRDGFRRIEHAASELESVFGWIREHGAADLREPDAAMSSRQLVRGEEHGHAGSSGETRREHFVGMAEDVQNAARQVRDAARRGDLPRVGAATGSISASCAGCHVHFRWEGAP